MMTGEASVPKVPKRVLSALLASVAAGVVPRAGAPYIAIGRKDEITALLHDMEEVNEGGGTMRFLIGRYGSGKSFLMQLVRGYALERDFLTADADLTPEHRLYGTGGNGVATYRELMKNLASKTSPDGGALPVVIARWIERLRAELGTDDPAVIEKALRKTFVELEAYVGGFDFARVMVAYDRALCDTDDEARAAEQKSACLRWFRGEYKTRGEAKAALGFPVSVIIDDENWYDFIKLWAALARLIGYRGLIVFIDECVNLYKIVHRVSRENNYEKILSMFNDTLQGRAPGLALILGGTPQFLEDTRRGLFSYEALRSRLCDSRFQVEGVKNLIGPVIRLRRLSDEELFALMVRITALHGQYYGVAPRITEDEMVRFLTVCLERAGADSMITPREMLRDYLTVLNLLMQNPELSFDEVVGKVSLKPAVQDGADGAGNVADAPAEDSPRKFTPEDLDF